MASWWVTLIVGLAVLLLGRRLFWLFVGAAGFAVGLHVAPAVLNGPEWLMVVVALVLGILGAVLAIFFQWLAIGLAGIVVAALALWLLDPILILLSALVGAALLAPLAPVSATVRPWLFIGLAVVGIAIQVSLLAPPDRAAPSRGRRT